MKNTRMPSKRALAVLDEPPATEPINKALRITEKVRRAIGLMVQGNCKTISEAAERVGLARESLGRALDKPHVAEFLRQKVIRHLATQAECKTGGPIEHPHSSHNAPSHASEPCGGDSHERINAGFVELLQRLKADSLPAWARWFDAALDSRTRPHPAPRARPWFPNPEDGPFGFMRSSRGGWPALR